jgi:hypothetical protein
MLPEPFKPMEAVNVDKTRGQPDKQDSASSSRYHPRESANRLHVGVPKASSSRLQRDRRGYEASMPQNRRF